MGQKSYKVTYSTGSNNTPDARAQHAQGADSRIVQADFFHVTRSGALSFYDRDHPTLPTVSFAPGVWLQCVEEGEG